MATMTMNSSSDGVISVNPNLEIPADAPLCPITPTHLSVFVRFLPVIIRRSPEFSRMIMELERDSDLHTGTVAKAFSMLPSTVLLKAQPSMLFLKEHLTKCVGDSRKILVNQLIVSQSRTLGSKVETVALYHDYTGAFCGIQLLREEGGMPQQMIECMVYPSGNLGFVQVRTPKEAMAVHFPDEPSDNFQRFVALIIAAGTLVDIDCVLTAETFPGARRTALLHPFRFDICLVYNPNVFVGGTA